MNISFSIITVTLNSYIDLKKTIDSVKKQTYKNYTHIIKDGLSTDKTNKIDFLKYEKIKIYKSKDKGVYNAMNQGFKFAKDEFIIYLNAGDIFFSENSLFILSKTILENSFFNAFSGGTLQIDKKNNKIKRLMGIGNPYKFLPFSQLPHPSFVIKRSLLDRINPPFDDRLKISADFKQQLILRKKNLLNIYFTNQILVIMPLGGISNKSKFSIIKGYIETFKFSFEIVKFFCFYIIILKIILNFYSKFNFKRFKKIRFKY